MCRENKKGNLDVLLERHAPTILAGRWWRKDHEQPPYDAIITSIYDAAMNHINHEKVAATIDGLDQNMPFFGLVPVGKDVPSAEGFVERLVRSVHIRWP